MIDTLTRASKEIARREVSPVDLVEGCLKQIEALDSKVRAFLHVDADGARRAAKEREKELTGESLRGPLHGIPIAIKDLIDVAGMPTTAASKVLARSPERDAPVVAILRKAGAVFLGKTNLDEFACGVVCEPTRNPWDLERIPGGSSGGSAAAVAARMCLGALGTDTLGSIRIPSAMCGVTGLKPRKEAVPMASIVPLSPSLDSCGPMAGSVSDVALLWEAIIGTRTRPSHKIYRIGIPGRDRLGRLSALVETVFADALHTISDAGVHLVEVDLPDFVDWLRPTNFLLLSEALNVHTNAGWYPERANSYGTDAREHLAFASGLSVKRLLEELAPLRALTQAFEEALKTVDALLLPTVPRVAPRIDEVRGDAKFRRNVTNDMARFTACVNPCRAATLSLPWRLASGLPVSLDVVAASQSTVLQVAERLEVLAPGVGLPF